MRPRYNKPYEIKRLEGLAFAIKKRRFPNNPYLVSPKFRDDNTNDLTKCIISFCYILGIRTERVANTGRNLNGKWIKGTGMNGTADVHAIRNGRVLMIEINVSTPTIDKATHNARISKR